MLSYEQVRAIENALGPQAAPSIIEVLEDMGNRVKADLLSELVTKKDLEQSHGILWAQLEKLRGDMQSEIEKLRGEMQAGIEKLRGEMQAGIEKLCGEMRTEIEKLRGEMRTENEKLRGQLGRIELMLKVLIGLAVIAIALFSPAASELIKLLK